MMERFKCMYYEMALKIAKVHGNQLIRRSGANVIGILHGDVCLKVLE